MHNVKITKFILLRNTATEMVVIGWLLPQKSIGGASGSMHNKELPVGSKVSPILVATQRY